MLLTVDSAWMIVSVMMHMDIDEAKGHIRNIHKRLNEKKLQPHELSKIQWRAYCFYERNRDLMDVGHN